MLNAFASGSAGHSVAQGTIALLCLLVAAQLCPAQPVAGLLPDDTWTRGNWRGVYGNHSYVLFGARSPDSLYGGPGWPVRIHGYTGDPKDPKRAWLSLMNTVNDDRALLEPKGEKRVAAIWDDHGETRKLGKGPGLFVDVDLPKGLCLLSLYFFEIDWIQFRHHQLTILDRNTKKPILTAPVGNYFGGKYKRFVIQGPLPITIRLETGMSPNATISGLFIDGFKELLILPRWSGRIKAGPATDDFKETVSHLRDQANEALAQVQEKGLGERAYVDAECKLLAVFDRLEKTNPRLFFRELMPEGRKAQERLDRFIRLASVPDRYEEGVQLAYSWARALMEPVRQKDYLELLEKAPRVYPPIYRDPAGANDPKVAAALQKAASAGNPKQAADLYRKLAAELIAGNRLLQLATVMENFRKHFPAAFTARDHFLLASGLLFMDRYQEALAELRASLEGKLPQALDARARLNAALCLLRLNRSGEAAKELEALEKQYPRRTETWHGYLELARYQKNAGQAKAARHTIEKILDNYEQHDSFLESVEELILQVNYADAKPPEAGAFILEGDRLPYIRFGDLEVTFTTAGAFVVTRGGDSVMDGGLTFHERGWKRWGAQIRRTSDTDQVQPGSNRRAIKFRSTLKDLSRKPFFALDETVSVVPEGIHFHYRVKALVPVALEMLGAEFHLPLREVFYHKRTFRFGNKPIAINEGAVKRVTGVFQSNGFSLLEGGADLMDVAFPKPGRWLLLDDRAYQLYQARSQYYAPVPGRAFKKNQQMEISFTLQLSRLRQSLEFAAGKLRLFFDDDGSFSSARSRTAPRAKLAAHLGGDGGAGRLLFAQPLLPAFSTAAKRSVLNACIFSSTPGSFEGIPFRYSIQQKDGKVLLVLRIRTADLQKMTGPGIAIEAAGTSTLAPFGPNQGGRLAWQLALKKSPALKLELPVPASLKQVMVPENRKFIFLPLKKGTPSGNGLTTDFHLVLSPAPGKSF